MSEREERVPLSEQDELVLEVLRRLRKPEEGFTPSNKLIAKETGLPRKAVGRSRKKIAKYLERKPGF